MDSAMISDDAPDPRNGKIIQCRVLARTLWVPWAGSLAGPWREAPCHYAAGLHHPHQYPIFGASPYNRRRIDKSSCSLRYTALLSFSVRSLLSPEALIVFFDATILRHHSATLPAFVPRESSIVRKYSKLVFLSAPPLPLALVFANARFSSHSNMRVHGC